MIKFVKLTLKENSRPLYLNIKYITSVASYEPTSTEIHVLNDDTCYEVSETVHQVMNAIERAVLEV